MSDVHAAQLIKELLRFEAADTTGKKHAKTRGQKDSQKHVLENVLAAGICAMRQAEAHFGEEHRIAGAAHINSPTISAPANSASTNTVPLSAAAQPPHHSQRHRQPLHASPSSPLHTHQHPPTPTKLPGYHYRQEPISGPRNAVIGGGTGGSVGGEGLKTKKSGCFPRWCFGPGKEKKEAPSTLTIHELARAPLPPASEAANLPSKLAQPSANPAALRHDRV
jgi:hypothetical protein